MGSPRDVHTGGKAGPLSETGQGKEPRGRTFCLWPLITLRPLKEEVNPTEVRLGISQAWHKQGNTLKGLQTE